MLKHENLIIFETALNIDYSEDKVSVFREPGFKGGWYIKLDV